MKIIDIKVEGMTCSNCALSVSKYLKKQGFADINVNPISGAVSFKAEDEFSISKINKGIKTLGYNVLGADGATKQSSIFLGNNKQRFLFCLPFTLVLMLHMLHSWLPLHWLMNSWVQLALCIPVFAVGMYFFGQSSIKSLRNGIPNMDVLIFVGSLAAFVYSVAGIYLNLGEDYLFFETAATIITLVFFGNYLEEKSIAATQSALQSLVKHQKVMANMIAFDDKHQEQIFSVSSGDLKVGDLLLIKTGEQVPTDCKIIWGDCNVSEAIITGESLPITKTKKDNLIGGTILESGTVKVQVTAVGNNTILSSIIKMVENAQGEKAPIQKLADKISAVFVPLVLAISVITFLVSYFAFNVSANASLMRSIAVLVISCPCAMGLATPAAISVGLGRAAKTGILFRNAGILENFKNIKQIVFDKTGTLTTGNFHISNYQTNIDDLLFKKIVFSIEKFSNHPIAKSICKHWHSSDPLLYKKVDEIKGLGMQATDIDGNVYKIGSQKLVKNDLEIAGHSLYVLKNDKILGWLDVNDEIRPEAESIIAWLKKQNIKTILLTGDTEAKANYVANKLGIDEVFASHTPEQKLNVIAKLNAESPTAMVGDGVNDAPALAKASIGISLSEASQLAVNSADVVLVNHGLKNLPNALGLGKHTYITIKQNLFWAFIYNIVAIPIAAMGMLIPMFAALAMGLSDVVLGINSVRLFSKKIV